MDLETRVCPFCGDPPGPGMFCAACGRNLAGVERLPTHGEGVAQRAARSFNDDVASLTQPAARSFNDDVASLADRCTAATAAFLVTMHAAGDPGRTSMPASTRPAFGRRPKVEGWAIRPVDRDDDAQPRRYEPGLFLSLEGALHRLDSELRGWGQRDFPQYYHTVSADPIDMPVQERLIGELSAVLSANGVAGSPRE